MGSKLILFSKQVRLAEAGAVVQFAIPETGSLTFQRADVSWDALALQSGLVRHPTFDGAVGDFGAKCALFESPSPEHASLCLGVEELIQGWGPSHWLTFPEAVRALHEGSCKRYLQLAVQFISAGGIVDELVASETSEELLSQIRQELTLSK